MQPGTAPTRAATARYSQIALGFQGQEVVDPARFEVRPGQRANVLAHFVFGPGSAVGPVAAQGIPYVHHREKARREGICSPASAAP